MTWLRDVVHALSRLGGEARWSDLVDETFRIRYEKNEYVSRFSTLRINFVLNENRDGKGRDIFTKVSRGIYRLKPPAGLEHLTEQQTLDFIIQETTKSEEEEFEIGIRSKLSKLKKFVNLISNKNSKETTVGSYLKNEPWIVGLEYLKVTSEDKIGLNGRTDFLLERIGGDFDIIELKSPNEKIFLKSSSQEYFRLSAISKDALSQMISYLSKYDRYYLFQREETKRDVLYPTGTIVIGRQKETDDLALATHNNFLRRIKFTTYDHLIESCRTILSNIKQNG